MIASFARFGPAHITAIGLTFIIPLVLSALARFDQSGSMNCVVGFVFAAILVINKIIGVTFLSRDGEITVASLVPMHLCDWAAITAVITLLHPNQWTYELCYFWALGGTFQALLTPDLREGFPHPQFISFFTQHGVVLAAVVYTTLAMKLRPVPESIIRVLAWSAVYLIVAVGVNLLLGTNFGYLRAKPEQSSLMDYLAPWPFYIIELGLLAILLCLAFYLPFFIIDRLRLR